MFLTAVAALAATRSTASLVVGVGLSSLHVIHVRSGLLEDVYGKRCGQSQRLWNFSAWSWEAFVAALLTTNSSRYGAKEEQSLMMASSGIACCVF